MRKVVINGRFLTQRITGVQRYAREIIAELDKIAFGCEFELAVPPEDNMIVPIFNNIRVVRIGKLHGQLWEQISYPLYVKKMHATSLNLCNVAPLIDPGIVCIFDMKIKVHPEFFSKKFLLWYSLLFFNSAKRAKLIITDSESARKDILKYYPYLKPENIIVVYPGWQHYERIGYDEDTLNKYKLVKQSFYFAMGSMEPNKNFKWIAEAAIANTEDIFAIAGSINEKVFSDGLGFTCPSNLKLLGYVSDKEAKTLMRDCKAFLFPSIYEGFGIPPLEAISAGCKRILVSNTEVMHEVFENYATYLDPYSIGSLHKIINISKPNKVLDKYSWYESARKLYEIIK